MKEEHACFQHVSVNTAKSQPSLLCNSWVMTHWSLYPTIPRFSLLPPLPSLLSFVFSSPSFSRVCLRHLPFLFLSLLSQPFLLPLPLLYIYPSTPPSPCMPPSLFLSPSSSSLHSSPSSCSLVTSQLYSLILQRIWHQWPASISFKRSVKFLLP